MFSWKTIIYTVVVVTVFLALTVIAAVRYNDSTADEANQNKLYRGINNVIEAVNEFFLSWTQRLNYKNEVDENKSFWYSSFKDYFKISQGEEGLIIMISNSQGEVVTKVLPIFKKKID
ncbi:MAG: hypothetical protein PWQ35_291 [Patescibacteria group bacterium]|nr:hypothetical protein [Patescibacteria group bacterium]